MEQFKNFINVIDAGNNSKNGNRLVKNKASKRVLYKGKFLFSLSIVITFAFLLSFDLVGQENKPAQTEKGVFIKDVIAAGRLHSLAIKSDGTVLAWGYNWFGQLGNETNMNTNNPNTTPVQVANLSNIVKIATGFQDHSFALKRDGTVWAWGENLAGTLGDGTQLSHSAPKQVSGLTDIIEIAAGEVHFLALKKDGTIWASGGNIYGELGDGGSTLRSSPAQVSGLTNVIAIAAGGQCSFVLKKDSTVWAWGHNLGKLGNGSDEPSKTPVRVSGLTKIIAISAGGNHALALKNDGTVWAWGMNEYGQLGDGTTQNRLTPIRVSGLNNIIDISAGGLYCSLALKDDGTVWAWGDNQYGQLGDGSDEQRTTPKQVAGLNNVISIASGGMHCLALKRDGALWGWGNNEFGQIRNGVGSKCNTPVFISNIIQKK